MFRGEVENVSAYMCVSEAGTVLVFSIGPKNTHLMKDAEILLYDKFCWIPCNGFRGEVKNVSNNQKPGQPSYFSDRPENTNLVQLIEILVPVICRWILLSSFRGKVENVSANQRLEQPSWFSDRPRNKHLGSGRCDLDSF